MVFLAGSAHAVTLTWTGAGDGTTFSQLQNWAGTPTGGVIDTSDLVDTYVLDTPATIVESSDLRFRAGGSLVQSAGSIDIASADFGMGYLENPDMPGTIELSGGSIAAKFLAELNVSLGSGAQLTLTGPNNPVNESSISFTDITAEVHFTDETTSAVLSEHVGKFTVFGAPAVSGVNLSIESDGASGSIVTPIITETPAVKLYVNRDTGQLTLTNLTGQALTFFEYDILSTAGALRESQWTSIAGNYDEAANGGDGSVDSDNAWLRFTAAGSRTNLAEGTFGETTLAHNQSIELGTAWIPSPYEDLQATLSLLSEDLKVEIVYTGTQIESPIEVGDFNADGLISAADWPLMRANLFTDVSGMLAVDAHRAGDMDGNGRVDELDFLAFEALYDANFGTGAFTAMVSQVPEPPCWPMFASVAGAIVFVGSRKRS
ncbi:hypothetical protein Pan181_49330 [Aeoliella mucimassa]|uniref:Dockerin domain-containing protein n=2 Tax=Aeoliella mucimassa TaxID=2527972 RepID=A0A518AVF5_9BACT|nr:hypothetical protein Pan181_49330 [Aeoliella mucimassa]